MEASDLQLPTFSGDDLFDPSWLGESPLASHGSPADSAYDSSLLLSPQGSDGLTGASSSGLSPQSSVSSPATTADVSVHGGPDSVYSSHYSPGSFPYTNAVEDVGGDQDVIDKLLSADTCQQLPLVQIKTEPGVLHRYRTANEMKSQHGGYVEGSITLPVDFMTRRLAIRLSAIPAALDAIRVHPCMLRIRIPDFSSKQRNKSTIFTTPLDTANDWKIELELINGEIFYKPNTNVDGEEAKKYNITNALEVDKKTREKQNVLLLGGGNCELTIINTLQSKGKEGGITVSEVIETRLKQEQIPDNDDVTSNQLTKKYISKKDSNYDLTKVRLRAQVMDLDTGATDQSISEVVADKGKVSDLKFISGPKSWCNKGGLDMIIVATKPQGDAVLILEDSDGSRIALQQAYPKANQIQTTGPTYESLSGTCKFQIPPQPDAVIQALAEDARRLKLTMKEKKQGKSSNSTYCETVFDFHYVAHRESNSCPYCAISSMTDYVNPATPPPQQPDQPVPTSRKRESSAGVLNDRYDTIDESTLKQILQTTPLPNVNIVGDFSVLELPTESEFMSQSQQQQDCSPRKRWCGSGGTCQVIPGGRGSVFNDPSRIVLDAPCRRRTVSSNDAMMNRRPDVEPEPPIRMVKVAKNEVPKTPAPPEKEEDSGAIVTILSGIVNSVHRVVGAIFGWFAGKML